MTLVLTEVSSAGIAMVADSAISFYDNNGNLSAKNRVEWRKLIWVGKIAAGVSYWGSIGEITRKRFDEWIEDVVKNGMFADLPSLAAYMASALNVATKNRPISRPMGLHIAGFHDWDDHIRRPVFFHVHNGDGHIEWIQKIDAQGKIELHPAYRWGPRKLFAAHRDLPTIGVAVPSEMDRLGKGWITSNGDFTTYSVIARKLMETCDILRTIPNVHIPRDSTKVGSRVALLALMMRTVMSIHKLSSLSKGIGGEISTLGIGPNGKYVGS